MFNRAFQKLFFKRRATLLGSVALILLLSVISKAERLPVKTYTVADGLLRDNVFKIKQDSRGFLWFCTAEGVSRFDGYGFTNFTVADGLPDRRVNDFLETKVGAIYIATDKGLVKLNPKGIHPPVESEPSIRNPKSEIRNPNNRLFTVILSANPRAKKINVLFEDEIGAVFAGTDNGLYKLNARDELEAVNLGNSVSDVEALFITSIIKDRRRAMWIGTANSGLFRLLLNGEVERFSTGEGLPGTNISTLLEDKNGRIWAGARPGNFADGLSLLVAEPEKNQKIVERIYTTKDGLPAGWITDLFEAGDGRFWVGTTRGLCLWQDGENSVCKIYTTKNDLCDQEVWTITEDKDKNLWLGSRCGAKKWARYGFTSYAETDGTGYIFANSIFENAAGELFASFNKGIERTVSRFEGEKFQLVKPRFPTGMNYFGWGWKQTVWQDRKGDWYFPTGFGLFHFQKPAQFKDLSQITPQKIETGAKGIEVFRFFEDSRGDFWIATTGAANELLHWERAANVWRDFTREAGFGKNRIGTSFVEDKSGNLWIGTGSDENDTALIRYRDGHFLIFTQAENEWLTGWLRDLFVDRAGRLWIADNSTGLLRLDDVNADRLNFTRYTPAEGLSSISASCVTEDEFGRIYAGTGRGIDRLTPETGQIENFTTADGLPNSNVEIAFRDQNNNLWFGTSDGLARLVPEPIRQRQPPNILIMNLRVSGEPQRISILGETAVNPPLELASDQRQFTIDLLGLGASLGEKLRYEYRFGESAWTATNERTVNFANLSSGDYQFEVRAITADRIYSQPATVAFRIATPLWQRWWFIAGLLALTGFLIYAFYRSRLLRLLELERMRTRIATDLHDDIGANLTRISLLSEVAKQKSQNRGDNLLTSIADIARESVSSMNDIVWAISPEHDSLLDLTRRMRRHAEEVFVLREIDLDFNAPTTETDLKLSVGVRRDLLLIFKETINNAARHSDCAKVLIDFRCHDSIVRLSIKDDGKGFEVNPDSDEGQGLRSIKRRANALGGNLLIDSRKNEGTLVAFEMSLPKTRSEI